MSTTWRSVFTLLLVSLAAAVVGCQQKPAKTFLDLPQPQFAHHTVAPQEDPVVVASAVKPVRHERPRKLGHPEWNAPGPQRKWKYIVIHHSATDAGSAKIFDRAHRGRGWDELGYHFVLCNGNGGADGLVEVGSRWGKQKWGAHCGGTPDNEYNNFGIGICLVGSYTKKLPSRRQLAALEELVTWLAAKYDIPPRNIIGHRDAPQTATCCPGNALHRYVTRTLRARVSGTDVASSN
jgi:N-acetyl-anhydromuramyl-L-alanine amidase AmpD